MLRRHLTCCPHRSKAIFQHLAGSKQKKLACCLLPGASRPEVELSHQDADEPRDYHHSSFKPQEIFSVGATSQFASMRWHIVIGTRTTNCSRPPTWYYLPFPYLHLRLLGKVLDVQASVEIKSYHPLCSQSDPHSSLPYIRHTPLHSGTLEMGAWIWGKLSSLMTPTTFSNLNDQDPEVEQQKQYNR